MKKLIAGNWKMNLTTAQVVELVEHLSGGSASADVLICPPFPYLSLVKHILVGKSILLGAQDCAAALSGAYTGDVSASMLADVECSHVIVGHSERRHGHSEPSGIVGEKAKVAVSCGLIPVICIGETDAENQAGITEDILLDQMRESIPEGLTADQFVLAYEPVWAIGTGRTASREEIVNAHGFIRRHTPAGVRILYGGSVNAKNAAEILALDNVNGVLVGGASLKADDFNEIIRAAG